MKVEITKSKTCKDKQILVNRYYHSENQCSLVWDYTEFRYAEVSTKFIFIFNVCGFIVKDIGVMK